MASMKPSKFLIMLRNNFHYRIGQKIAYGRDLYYDNDWAGYVTYDRMTDQVKGFVIAYEANHLRTLCVLHDQRIL